VAQDDRSSEEEALQREDQAKSVKDRSMRNLGKAQRDSEEARQDAEDAKNDLAIANKAKAILHRNFFNTNQKLAQSRSNFAPRFLRHERETHESSS